jgi:uncharacterized protein (DUF169 family)
MERKEVAGELVQSLGLRMPPIALAFAEVAPENVQAFIGEVPSACSFWRQAESGVFYASAAQHFNCLIGAMTMGFEMSSDESKQLTGLVGQMMDCGYIGPDEPAKIPSVAKPKSGIIYGPLAQFPSVPDLILLWVTPMQGMLLSEAEGGASWTGSNTRIFGRPSCAALPIAYGDGQFTLSAGCIGMRTFTEVPEDLLLAVVPGDQLDGLVQALRSTMSSNQTMRTHYESQKARFAPAR